MFFKSDSYLGVDIGASGVKLVELQRQKARPVLFTYGMTIEKHDIHNLTQHQSLNKVGSFTINLKDDPDYNEKQTANLEKEKIDERKIQDYANQLKGLCKASRTSTKKAVVSLPVSSVFHAVVTVPVTNKAEELQEFVRAEVKKFILLPLEDMSLDYQPLNKVDKHEKQKDQRIVVNAVPNTLISFYSKVFQRAGLLLEALEPESSALTRSLVGRDNSVNLLVDIGAERTNFFIIDQSMPVTNQSIDFGGNKADKIIQNILNIEDEYVDQIKRDLFNYHSGQSSAMELSRQKLLEILMPIAEPIVKEIEISLDLYLRQIGNVDKKVEKIILTGGTAFLPYLTDYISDKFKIKCYIGDPWARVVCQQGLKPVLHEIGPCMSVAIGLALRNMV
ncbi:MAG: type IV pilus assembly protein PilM [bacterium]